MRIIFCAQLMFEDRSKQVVENISIDRLSVIGSGDGFYRHARYVKTAALLIL
jgi:hypothetical protein